MELFKEQYFQYLPYLGQGLIFSLLLTPIIGLIAKRLKIMDLPPSMRKPSPDRDRRLEKPPVPLLGGLAVIIPFLILILINGHVIENLWWLFIPTLILVIMGVFDDKLNLSFKIQLAVQILAALIFALSPENLSTINIPGTNIVVNLSVFTWKDTFLGIPLSLSIPGDLILLTWIVVVINALKVNGGTDALLEGNSALALIIVFLISARFFNESSAFLSITLAGCLIGYAIYNFYPGKIHSGSSGKSVYGFLIAALAIKSGAKLATTFVALALPLTDLVFVVIQRVIETKPQKISDLMTSGDKRHLHHKLLAINISEPKIALIEYTITLTIGLLGALVSGLLKLAVILLVPVLILGFIFFITILPKIKKAKEEKDETPEDKYSY
ncbi:undecaprenyl/decaprenyl-phosphate alpha-N-acetylglucosaminyl 1-phosphate transferase [Candidatus Dojkabacteria bacterium]|nr:undecaprenyl/decaprenyl-phosphate alpha-N-acetylglucosaminyl 1-phosphate transferase [Candidatus Dojkabacteria bacterium]